VVKAMWLLLLKPKHLLEYVISVCSVALNSRKLRLIWNAEFW